MSYSFANVPKVNVPRSLFRRNHNLKTTINTDFLYPIYVDEALPSDVFKFKAHLFARLSTPLTPIMDSLYLDTFFFAVPVRLVDKEFLRLMGERPFGDVRNDYTVPMLDTGSGVAVGSLSDYLGIPTGVSSLDFCPWWHRAYNLVYNEWFRDENLCPARPIAGVHEDGTVTDEALSDYVLCRRGKRKDYFTGCLPWPQKGSVSSFNLGSVAPVFSGVVESADTPRGDNIAPLQYFNATTGEPWSTPATLGINSSGKVQSFGSLPSGSSHGAPAVALYANLADSAVITVNQLREAFAIQHFLEGEARGGCSRYTEVIRSHFNTVSPDSRLQRPEYLGGSSQRLNVTTVAQTSASVSGSTPQGNLAAFVTVNEDASWTKTFTEHTLIIGLANVRADLSYQQGLPRMFSRRTKFDFYWPELANLGEQAVLNKEIYAQGTADDDDVFGYQERWAEYRYHPDMITGQFRSTYANSLDYWHLAQKFTSLPVLNQSFVEEHVPIDRVLAVNTATAPNMILDGWFEVSCARPMPLYSVPGLTRL